MKRLLIFVSLFSFANGLYAQEIARSNWRLAASTKDELVYYNKSRFTRLRGIMRVWLKYVEKENEEQFAIIHEEYDCNSQRTRTVSEVEYLNGRVLRSTDTPKARWKEIVPDSVSEALYGIFCSGDKDLGEIFEELDRRAEQDRKEDGHRQFDLALKSEARGDYTQAIIFLQWAVKAEPQNKEYQLALERVRRKQAMVP